jgi:PAS domain S-box-containing protein
MASILLTEMREPADPLVLPPAFETFSDKTLAALLDQSVDCIKLIGPDGNVLYMNRNGRCAMEVEDFGVIVGRSWTQLWPADAQPLIEQSLIAAAQGRPARFEAFCPTAKGSPRWWDVSVSQVRDRGGAVLGFLSVSRDISEAHAAREAAEIAAAEMRHRLKNSYAMVGGLLAAFARGNPAREEFVGEMRDRLAALGVAQTLFVARDDAPCAVAELLPVLLSPFSQPDCPVSAPDLPDLTVSQSQADAIALVLGELAVNAAKHGALAAGGEIVVGARSDAGALVVTWSETSIRRVEAHARSGGQGLRLMQRILAARGGEIDIDWKTFGLDATLRFAAPRES